MTLKQIAELIDAEIISRGSGNFFDAIDMERCYSADLMSDVLAFCPPDALLVTGLANAQVIRTAEVADIRAVVFVQSKKPDHETLMLARERGLPVLMTTAHSSFEVCVRLHQGGMRDISQ